MVDGILDLTVMIIILAVVLAISMSLIVPLVNESWLEAKEINYDKTVSKTEGENVKAYGDYDGTMSKLEVILTTQVMDFGSPEPRKIKVDGTTINITSTYKTELMQYAQIVWSRISGDAESTRYEYQYDFGNAAVIGDESYTIIRK